MKLTRRTVRLVNRRGQPPTMISKKDGTVVATGADALAVQRVIFLQRFRGGVSK
jgi:hypothetical protein